LKTSGHYNGLIKVKIYSLNDNFFHSKPQKIMKQFTVNVSLSSKAKAFGYNHSLYSYICMSSIKKH